MDFASISPCSKGIPGISPAPGRSAPRQETGIIITASDVRNTKPHIDWQATSGARRFPEVPGLVKQKKDGTSAFEKLVNYFDGHSQLVG